MTYINSLWSLDGICGYYAFVPETMQVINTATSTPKKICVDKRGYPYVNLQRIDGRVAKVKMHKIVALSLIRNAPYVLIEHLDDDPLNFDPANLKFSDKRGNAISMYRNGISNHSPATFEVCTKAGAIFQGTMKYLAEATGVPISTLYYRFYTGGVGKGKRGIRYVRKIES